jgi:hypothetical protein
MVERGRRGARPADHGADPGRWGAWEAARDIHEVVAPELGGPVLDVGCARDNDPELMGAGYPPPSFDAEEAVEIVGTVFRDVEPQQWDARFAPLATREEVRAYCRHHFVPAERAEEVEVPLWSTKRGVLVRATKLRPLA